MVLTIKDNCYISRRQGAEHFCFSLSAAIYLARRQTEHSVWWTFDWTIDDKSWRSAISELDCLLPDACFSAAPVFTRTQYVHMRRTSIRLVVVLAPLPKRDFRRRYWHKEISHRRHWEKRGSMPSTRVIRDARPLNLGENLTVDD